MERAMQGGRWGSCTSLCHHHCTPASSDLGDWLITTSRLWLLSGRIIFEGVPNKNNYLTWQFADPLGPLGIYHAV